LCLLSKFWKSKEKAFYEERFLQGARLG